MSIRSIERTDKVSNTVVLSRIRKFGKIVKEKLNKAADKITLAKFNKRTRKISKSLEIYITVLYYCLIGFVGGRLKVMW